MRRALKWTVLTTLIPLAILTVGTIVVCKYPVQTFELVKKYFLPKDLKITWEKLQLKIDWRELPNFSLNCEIEDLLLQKTKPLLKAQFQSLHLNAQLETFKRRIRIKDLTLVATDAIEFQAEAKPENPSSANLFQQVRTWADYLALVRDRANYEKVKVQIADLSLLNLDEKQPAFHLGLDVQTDSLNSPLRLQGKLWRADAADLIAEIQGQIDPQLIGTDQQFLSAELKFNGFQFALKQTVSGFYSAQTAKFHFNGGLQYLSSKLKIMAKPSLQLILKPELADLEMLSDVEFVRSIKAASKPIPKLNNLKLKLSMPLEENKPWSERATDYSIEAPVQLEFIETNLQKTLQKSCDCQLPLRLIVQSKGQFWPGRALSNTKADDQIFDGKISIENVKNKLFFIDLAATLKIEKNKSQWKFLPYLESEMTVLRFRDLTPLFERYNILLPAPLDILDGSVQFLARGPINFKEDFFTFPLKVLVDLTSPAQKVKLSTEADIQTTSNFKKVHIQSKTVIQDLQIELPPLNPVRGTPRVISDDRILQKPQNKNKKSEFKVTFDIQVETASNGSIRLLSQYFKPYLPLTLKVQSIPGRSNEGFIRAEPFEIAYLRRKVQVEKLQLDLSQMENEIIPVQARLKVQQTIYTVYIDVAGNTSSPSVTLSSEPYLPESEIISVLLYDHTSEQLAASDAETAGNVRAAVADRAIGLFGLWAFASTPIRSFAYNPVTKVYTATVALGNGVSARIGTTWESTAQLELRKRISKRWVLTAKWSGATETEAKSTKMVLQWEKRF